MDSSQESNSISDLSDTRSRDTIHEETSADAPEAYRAILFSRSSVKLKAPLRYSVPDCTINIIDKEMQSFPTYPIPEADWLYSAVVTARSPIAALNIVKRIASFFCDTIVCTNIAAVGEPEPFIAVSLKPPGHDLKFAQVLYGDFSKLKSRRLLEIQRLNNLHDAVSNIHDDKLKQAIVRSLHLLRRCLVDSNPADQFQDLWSGLESLNHHICRKFSCNRKYPLTCQTCKATIRCEKCKQLIQQRDSSSGIRYVVCTLLKQTDREWSTLRKSRVNVVHAIDGAAVLGETLQDKLPLLLKALVTAIAELLGISENDLGNSDGALTVDSVPRMLCSGVISGSISSDATVVPYVQHRLKAVPERNPPHCQIELSLCENFKFVGNFTLEAFVQKGPNDEGLVKLTQAKPEDKDPAQVILSP